MVRMMTEGIVNRFLSSTKAEMLQKNEKEITCSCRRCKLKSLIADPDSGQVRDHLLLHGFMDGYRWQGDEDDYEVVHGGRTTNEQDSGGREDKESPGHDHDGDAVHSHHVEDAGHHDEEGQDEGHDHEDEDVGGADDDGPSMGWVQDPHI